MAKLKEVLDLLKKQGVEISAEAAAAVHEKFDGQLLVPADQLVGEGQIAVSEKAWNERGEDLSTWKNRAKKAEQERDELQEAADAGDSHNKTLADKYKTELDRLKPLVERYTKGLKKSWEEASEKIPENLHKYYTFAEEGKELTDEQLAANVEKLTEHLDLNAFELEGETSPGSARTNPSGKTSSRGSDKKETSEMSRSEKMLNGYGKKEGSDQR